MKLYVIPEDDIRELEEARCQLFEIMKDHPMIMAECLKHVTGKIWKLTHKKYPIATDYAIVEAGA